MTAARQWSTASASRPRPWASWPASSVSSGGCGTVGGQGAEPAVDGLRRAPDERGTLAGDGSGGGVPVLAGDPLRHRIGPASRRLEGVCQTRRHGTALGRRHLLLEATAQELAEQRMEAAGTGIARSGQKEPAPLAKAARTDAGGVGDVEVGRRGRGEQLVAPLGIEATSSSSSK